MNMNMRSYSKKMIAIGMAVMMLLTGSLTASAQAEQPTWRSLGKSVSPEKMSHGKIDVDKGIPYVLLLEKTSTDWNDVPKLTVRKYENRQWEMVGQPYFSNYSVSSVDFVIDVYEGVPYVAYIETERTFPAKTTIKVKRFNGIDWEMVGDVVHHGGAQSLSLKVDGSANAPTPYVAYSDCSNSCKANVQKFNGTEWEFVGSPNFSKGWANTNLAVYKGVPYVVYQEPVDTTTVKDPAVVMKFTGKGATGWLPIGNEIMGEHYLANNAVSPSLVIGEDGQAYVSFIGDPLPSAGGYPRVLKYNGNLENENEYGTWTYVGGDSRNNAWYRNVYSMVTWIDRSTPYLSIVDSAGYPGPAIVLRLNPTGWEQVGGSSAIPPKGFRGIVAAENGEVYLLTSDDGTNGPSVRKYGVSTYSVVPIADQVLAGKMVGYEDGAQETRSLNIEVKGSGDLENLSVELSGSDASKFEITQPASKVLNDDVLSTTFTVRAKDDLPAGTYSATVAIKADKMADATFTVTQKINNRKGDLNGDGKVTPADAMTVTKYLNGKMIPEPSEEEKREMDVNEDGVIDTKDVQAIMNLYLGIGG